MIYRLKSTSRWTCAPWILVLPISQLLKLQLVLKKTIYQMLMFGVGTCIIITVISIIRFPGLLRYSFTTILNYNNFMVAIYSIIECNVSIMCCCMPAVLALLRRTYPQIFGSASGFYERSDEPNKPHSLMTFSGSGVTPKPKRGIQKSVTNTVSYETKPDDGSD
ncbi:uncharacterized protein J7T54_008522 [Emericellopsis cladophorae]|uniref:Rhodopsin domain-containing protein n=1 Tax=Emericellopsis cladophorae TaxID=2686198 RepID=A0A9Q0BDW0_9HYPO|nr:uncharacterized protein J7T54_008522 [Emericellopsis cladophorae]KAI6780604.1 hypothetical protein J7T54_008522 [Emericellopsis cladophorae]